jgi:hypothetical protein
MSSPVAFVPQLGLFEAVHVTDVFIPVGAVIPPVIPQPLARSVVLSSTVAAHIALAPIPSHLGIAILAIPGAVSVLDETLGIDGVLDDAIVLSHRVLLLTWAALMPPPLCPDRF